MQCPGKGQGDGKGDDECEPVAEVMMLHWQENKLTVDEIYLERDGAYPCYGFVDPLRHYGKESAKQYQESCREGDVDKSLQEDGESAVKTLLKVKA